MMYSHDDMGASETFSSNKHKIGKPNPAMEMCFELDICPDLLLAGFAAAAAAAFLALYIVITQNGRRRRKRSLDSRNEDIKTIENTFLLPSLFLFGMLSLARIEVVLTQPAFSAIVACQLQHFLAPCHKAALTLASVNHFHTPSMLLAGPTLPWRCATNWIYVLIYC